MSVWNSSGLDSGEMRAGAQNNTSVVLTSEQQVGENHQQQHPPRHDHDHQYHYLINEIITNISITSSIGNGLDSEKLSMPFFIIHINHIFIAYIPKVR